MSGPEQPKVRYEGEILPEGWSITDCRGQGGRVHLAVRVDLPDTAGRVIAHIAIRDLTPEGMSGGYYYVTKEQLEESRRWEERSYKDVRFRT